MDGYQNYKTSTHQNYKNIKNKIIIQSMNQKDYNHIKIPKDISEKIQELAINSGMYRNVSEFVIENTRIRLRDLER